jgi:TetR/AcrR family transcriptional repressor of nem operon
VAASSSAAPSNLPLSIAKWRRASATPSPATRRLAALIRQGQADHSIPGAVDPEAAARVLVYLTQGMRVVGKAGRQPPDTAAVVEIAMKLVT